VRILSTTRCRSESSLNNYSNIDLIRGQLARSIEQSYPKAEHPNMKLLKSWNVETNADGEEVCVFEFEDRQDVKEPV
jgi:hypothetical protein